MMSSNKQSPFISPAQSPLLSPGPSPSLLKKETANTNTNQYMLDSPTKSKSYVLDTKELNELLNVNVYAMAQNANKAKARKGSDDENVYVEETLLFLFNPNSGASNGESPKKGSVPQLSVDELRKFLLIEVHKYDESEDLENEQRILKMMMDGSYADEEIDNILETFAGKLNSAASFNGEFLDNDIRISENIRETIDEIKQLQRAAGNKAGELDRRRFLQSYVESAELLGVSMAVEHLLPALLDIFKQDDGSQSKGYVKLIFQNLSRLLDFLSKSEITVGYNGIRDYIMPLFQEFFQSDRLDETVKQDLQPEVIELLVKTSNLMTNEDRADKVLPIILENIRDDSDEEKRILGLELVDKLAEQIGKDNCQNFLMYEIISLQDDPIYRVRKETILRMINISKVLGKEMFLKFLFPVFKKLANDSIWGVRRSAVEVLPQISMLSPVEIKNGILIEMFKKFTQDSSKWVKMATFQYLGPFIATYEGIEISPVLVDYYISMCEQYKSTAADNEVPYHCAYNFPAVLYTLGPKAWPKLQPVYDQLVKDPRAKVRRTLAFSMHEIAKILGPELTEKELVSVLYHFMKDVNEVKEGVNATLPKFIKMLSPESRESYVEKFANVQVDTQDWRKRVALAKQIKQFSKVFSAQTVHKYYIPIFFQLCQDQVAEVRIEAAKAVKNILTKLQEDQDLFQDFVRKILLFKDSNKFNLRQTFIQMCGGIMLNKGVFVEHFLQHLCQMQRDRIINVRMELCEMLAQHYKTQPSGGLVQELKELRMMVKVLKLDQRDVSDILEDVNITYLPEDSDTTTTTNITTDTMNTTTTNSNINPAQSINDDEIVQEQYQVEANAQEESKNDEIEVKSVVEDMITKVDSTLQVDHQDINQVIEEVKQQDNLQSKDIEDKYQLIDDNVTEEAKTFDNLELVKEVLDSVIDSIDLSSSSDQKDSEIQDQQQNDKDDKDNINDDDQDDDLP